jgi:hypothetical protein
MYKEISTDAAKETMRREANVDSIVFSLPFQIEKCVLHFSKADTFKSLKMTEKAKLNATFLGMGIGQE